jgi:hypothetical protein
MPALRFAIALIATIVAIDATPALAETAPAYDKVSFYFAAHEDDWQLFMNPTAFQDVARPATKTVFVHMTAGDAGLGTGNAGRKHPYYLARENGAATAIRFMADTGERPRDHTVSRSRFNGHQIVREAYRNTVTYFLRVPDGHPTGSGFRETGNQSLERLASGQIDTIAAIDGSTVYRGWNDLVATVRKIMDYERGSIAAVQLNVAELDTATNPQDHSDHRMTAKAALEAARTVPCARRLHYVDYASAHLPENLDAQQRDMESSVLAATAVGILALDHTSIWAQYHRTYLGRNYFRVEESSGPCGTHAALQPVATPASGAKPR